MNHPNFFNLRRVTIAFMTAPFLFLMLVIVLDASIHRIRMAQASGQWCTKSDLTGSQVRLYGRECE
jgi:hypothetical protein